VLALPGLAAVGGNRVLGMLGFDGGGDADAGDSDSGGGVVGAPRGGLLGGGCAS